MSGKSTIDQIRHYQKDIERCPENAERMMRCIQRLYILPITLEHLQQTGVGRSVNSLRKFKGEVGDAAKALVTKWKAMVAAEESGEEDAERAPENGLPTVSINSHSKTDQVRSEEKNKSTDKHHDKHHKKSNHSEKKSHTSVSAKSLDKDIVIKSSSKSLSSSSKNLEKENKNNRNHESRHDKKRRVDSEGSEPSIKKFKNYHSSSNDIPSHCPVKKEEPPSSEVDSDEDVENDVSGGEDSDEGSKQSSESEEKEADSDSSSDHRHRSKHKSSHHRHKHSSHSKEREKEMKFSEAKDKGKGKENHSEHHRSKKHESSKKGGSPPDYNELIKENEKKVKKEKKDEFSSPKKTASKNVKLETNEDGSIDSGSGASFADALLGMDSYGSKKNKKPSSTSSSQPKSPSKLSKSSENNSSPSEEKASFKSKPSSSHSRPRTLEELVEPPELLSKKVKLEALDLDISSTLPEIDPNYKPLPHVPERAKQFRAMSAEDHMFSIMTTKNQRTKVFSGNKVSLTEVPSLYSMCIQLLYENIDAVEYTGGVPYHLLKPLLEKLNADQLYVLEHFNPYLIEDTDELWKFHSSKEFRCEKRQDMESWRELYVRCMDERERKLKALTANITQSMAKSTPVRQAKLAYVDAVVKPPRNIARKQAKFGTGVATPNPKKQEIVSKAMVGANTPGITVEDSVPTPRPVARAMSHHPNPALLKKKKAPLMQKALQVMKGTRYKR